MGIFEVVGAARGLDDRRRPRSGHAQLAHVGAVRPVIRHPPPTLKRVRGSWAAREVEDAWIEHWPQLASSWYFWEAHTYGTIMGWSDGQIDWDTTDTIWKPYPRFWHPRYGTTTGTSASTSRSRKTARRSCSLVTASGIHQTPKGDYRGWMWGALRAIAEPWLIRHFALRDMARYSERHGMPIIKAYTPAAAKQAQRDRFEQQVIVARHGDGGVVGRGVDENDGFDLALPRPRAATGRCTPVSWIAATCTSSSRSSSRTSRPR